MDKITEYQELVELRKKINLHNYHYHVLDSPLISDKEYDGLMRRLLEIESQHPNWVTPASPSQRAGGKPQEKFLKILHPAPILSLANAFNPDEILAWYERNAKLDKRMENSAFVLEPKIDGLTVVLHYKEGKFILGATRGDGVEGEDITRNLMTIKAIPLQIPVDGTKSPPNGRFIVRGEVFIKILEFQKLNQRLNELGERTYQNPRNTAAGSLRQLDPELTAKRPLTILNYAIVYSDSQIPKTQWEVLEYLKILGFPVSDQCMKCNSIGSVIAALPDWENTRDFLPFEIDGVVIKTNDLNLAGELGSVGKDPRCDLAYKFASREVSTRLLDIGVAVGRTGVLTPYAILQPVDVGGVTVKQATLHNFEMIETKDIRIGDTVLIKRAGDVIPYVIGPIKDMRTGIEGKYIPPERCPACFQLVEHFPGEVAWFCVNGSCPAQLIRNVEHFVSREAMAIEGMGIKVVELLVESKKISDVADIYTLKKPDLLELEGFADKKAENLIKAIEESRKRPLNRLLFGLGIRGVGEVVAGDLAMKFHDLDRIISLSITDLQDMEGVGPIIALAIKDWFERPTNNLVIQKLRSQGIWPVQIIERNRGNIKLNGKSFVISGTLQNFSRTEAEDFIKTNGGRVSDSVNKKTHFLLLGIDPGSKYAKAKELGIPIIDEIQLRNLVEGE